MSDKTSNRLDKIKELKNYYDRGKRTGTLFKWGCVFLVVLAWVSTLLIRFTLPFFALHTTGTAMGLYYYTISNEDLKTWGDYITDSFFWALLVITLIGGVYILMSASHCSLAGTRFY